ncbi:MAG TPA: histidine--tRNA ligase, partial [Anaerolineales bacterium]|nr:histidine--tRNA ligase [Anaerolineales bacterium]
MKRVIPAVKGTRDFYPEQMAVRTWLYSMARSVAESFGYQEYEAPILESLDLYVAKSGDELVNEQAYVFEDRGGDKIALRPELTASLARMVAQRQGELAFPLRWWSYGPFWRYERPQRGRTREFFQWNVDMLGASSPEADAENVAVLATFLGRVGLNPKQVMILVNDRRLANRSFDALGIEAARRPAFMGLLDRRSKLAEEAWRAAAIDLGMSASQLSELEAVLRDQELWKSSAEMRRFFGAIDALGVSEYVRYDPSIVRGLQYYTGTVFEAWEVGGEIRRSLLGGGRYDNLLSDVGGGSLPAVGFAMGDVVMTLLLEKYGLIPADLHVNPARILVTVFDADHQSASLQLASELRATGLNVALYPDADKLARQFKYADRIQARIALVVGPEELLAG